MAVNITLTTFTQNKLRTIIEAWKYIFKKFFNDIENIKWIIAFIFIFQQPFYAEQDKRNFIKC